jgi:hypothetical protein
MVKLGRENAGKTVAVKDLLAAFSGNEHARKATDLWATWKKEAPVQSSWVYHPRSFLEDLDHTLIVYGTARDKAANKEAAMVLQKAIRDTWSNVTVEVEADATVTEDELKSNHVLVVGAPRTNTLAAQWAKEYPAIFSPQTFTVGYALYANPASALITAAKNPLNPRFCTVVVAGNSAAATVVAVDQVMKCPVMPAVVCTPQGKLLPVLPGK